MTGGPAPPVGSSGRFVRSAIGLSLAQLLPQVFTLVLSVAAARFLGPADMGRQSYLSFVVIAATSLGSLGLPLALQRFVASAAGAGRPDRVAALALRGWGWSVGGAALAAAAVRLVGTHVYPDLALAWWLAAAVAAIGVLSSASAGVLFGLRRFGSAVVVGLVAGAVGVPATIYALALGHGIVGMFAVELAVLLVVAVGTTLLALRAVRTDLPVASPLPPGQSRQLLRFTVVVGVGMVVEFVLTRRSEFVFLERFSSDRELAWYSVAFSAVTVAARLPLALVQVVLPTVAALAGAGEHHRIPAGFSRACRLILVASLPLSAIAVALGPSAVRVLYGEEYAAAGSVLVTLALPLLLVAPLAAVATGTLQALDDLRSPLQWGLVAVVVTLLLDLLLIPPHGSTGAALANAGGHLTVGVAVVVVATRRMRVSWWRPALARAALISAGAGALAAGTVRLAPTAGWALTAGSVMALASLAAGCLRFGLLDPGDAEWLDAAVWSRAGPAGALAHRLTTVRGGRPAARSR